MQVNHTVFEKKHHYMTIMKEIEKLRRQMEYEALNDSISKERLNELYNTRELIFAGLLREGLLYQYIQNASTPEEDKIRLTVDNVDYDCKVSSLKSILKNDFDFIIKEKERSDLVKPKIIENNKNEETSLENVASSVISPVPIVTPISLDDSIDSENNSDLENQENNDKETENDENDSVLKENMEMIEESEKRLDTFVYDYMEVTPIREGAVRGETFIVYVAPLELYNDNNRPDIAVWVKGPKGTVVTGVSDNIQKPVKIDCDGQSFIIRGSFKKGLFESHILPADTTLNMGFNLKTEKDEHRCLNNKMANRGHIYYILNNMKIHVFPISEINERNGNAKCLVVIDNGLERKTFSVPHSNGNKILINNKEYGILNYWDGTTLVSEMLNEGTLEIKDQKKNEVNKKNESNKNIGVKIFSKIKNVTKRIVIKTGSIISTLIHLAIWIAIIYIAWKLFSNTELKASIVNFVLNNVGK